VSVSGGIYLNITLVKTYFIVLLILLSGTVYFSLAYSEIFIIVLFISSIILLYKKKTMRREKIKILIICFVFLLINVIFNINNSVSYTSIIALIIKIASVSIIFSCLSIKDFKKYYINVIIVLCLISLISFYVSQIAPDFSFPLMKYKVIGGNWFMYAPYHTWGWETAFNRNAGMFWEPGAFQAFINLAVLMLIDIQSEDITVNRKNILIFILFGLTILSTKSTTGYIILFICVCYLIFININILKNKLMYVVKNMNKKNMIYAGIVILFIVSVVIFIASSNVITEKFSNRSPSYSIRSNDFYNSFKIIVSRPIVGYGYMSKATSDIEKVYGITDNSNGLLYFTYMFGVPFTIIFIVFIYRGVKALLPNINPLLSLAILTIIFMTEYLMLMPLYLAIMVIRKESQMKKLL
jgi:hypothetical protein